MRVRPTGLTGEAHVVDDLVRSLGRSLSSTSDTVSALSAVRRERALIAVHSASHGLRRASHGKATGMDNTDVLTPGRGDHQEEAITRKRHSPGRGDHQEEAITRKRRSPGRGDHQEEAITRKRRSPGRGDHQEEAITRKRRSPGRGDHQEERIDGTTVARLPTSAEFCLRTCTQPMTEQRTQKRFSIVLRLRTFPRGFSQFQETPPSFSNNQPLLAVPLFLRNALCPGKPFPFSYNWPGPVVPLSHSPLRPGKASCPGRYESVSYQLGSERKESCYFVSTDYIKWEDGGDFCARNHNGYLAEFVYLAEWEAFKTFFTNIPNATKWQLYDTHVWIGAGTIDGKVWRWNGSGANLSQIVPELEQTPLIHFSVNDSYGMAVNVYSGYMEQHRLRSAYCLGYPNMHSYVCETDQRIDKEPLSPSATKCQRDLQDGSRDQAEDLDRAEKEAKKISQNLTACEREMKKSKQDYDSLVSQFQEDNMLSQNLTECRTDLGRKEKEVKVLRLALGIEDDSGTEDLPQDLVECQKNITEVKDVLSLKEQTILSLREELQKTEEVFRRERGRISALEGELRALEGELGEERRLCATKEEMISRQQELLVVKEERTAALERELGEERRLGGTKEELRKDLDEAEKERDALKTQLGKLRKDLKEAEKERDALKRQLEELRKEQPKECPSGFFPVGLSCYAVFDTELLSWDAAQAFCRAKAAGGRLAELEMEAEITRLKDHLKGNGYYCGSLSLGPWIGAIEKGDSNTFMWHSSKAAIDEDYWAQSRPYTSTSGDGVALDASDDFQWIDLSSGTELPFLCEIPSNPRPDESEDETKDLEGRFRELEEALRKKDVEVEEALRKMRKDLDEAEKERNAPKRQLGELRKEQPKECPSGFVSVGHSCYAVFDEWSRTWDSAQAFCKAKAAGGRLAELETKEEIARLKDHLKGNGYYCKVYWIGGEEVGDTNTFAWASTGQRIGDSDW
ncbi:unnamed protein product [Cyprideis torosa]|uniref:Uncharacterized protein n=1 Tax=Cyprideis torosa TaxID=163714 RepID=A0A7R8ZUK2_9CRUS|nr:unnamed protein product [Cyprideis torosa]CAG0900873.1 unnamed protein product [Cyprideis torosa]